MEFIQCTWLRIFPEKVLCKAVDASTCPRYPRSIPRVRYRTNNRSLPRLPYQHRLPDIKQDLPPTKRFVIGTGICTNPRLFEDLQHYLEFLATLSLEAFHKGPDRDTLFRRDGVCACNHETLHGHETKLVRYHVTRKHGYALPR